MPIDISNLIVRQKYFIPKQRGALASLILEELDKDGSYNFLQIYPWQLYSLHSNSLSFTRNPQYDYLIITGALMKQGGDSAQEIKKRLSELYKMEVSEKQKRLFSKLQLCLPEELNVDIIDSDEQGVRIEVELIPILYFNVTMLKPDTIEEISIQKARLTGERFLKTLFSGGLSGILISEDKNYSAQENTSLLINDVKNHQIAKKIEEVLDGATGEVLIMAWMGTILLTKLRALKEKGISIKVITGTIKDIRQDVMQREKEKAFEELISIVGPNNICIKRDFHGRAIIVDNKAFIGSMDLDSYSLTGARNEFAIYTENAEIVRTIRNYFNYSFIPKKQESQQSH